MAIIKLKRGPANQRETFTPEMGELILDTTNNLLYVGDGITPGGILITNSSANIADKIADGDLRLSDIKNNRKILLDNWEDVINDSSDIEGRI
jgi:hypothetical protein